jgi:chromosome segregation ATPase
MRVWRAEAGAFSFTFSRIQPLHAMQDTTERSNGTTETVGETHTSGETHIAGETHGNLSSREEIAEAVLNLPEPQEGLEEENEQLQAENERLRQEIEDLKAEKEAAQESLQEQKSRREEAETELQEAQAILEEAEELLNVDGPGAISEEIKSRLEDFSELAEMHQGALAKIEELEEKLENQEPELGDAVYEVAEALDRRTGIYFIDDGKVDFDLIWRIIDRIDENAQKLNEIKSAL